MFVSLIDVGDRDFVFYRNFGVDELYEVFMVFKKEFDRNILYFCFVLLIDNLIKEVYIKVIEFIRKYNGLVSFDLNIRLVLW